MNTIILPFVANPDCPVRIGRADDGRVGMLLGDVERAVRYPRSTLARLIRRNEKLFGEWCFYAVITTAQTGGNGGSKLPRGKAAKRLLFVTKEGLVALLSRLTTSRIRDPKTADRVLGFQRWAILALTALLEGRLPAVPDVPIFPPEMLAGRKRAHLVRSLCAFYGRKPAWITKRLHRYEIAMGLPHREAGTSTGKPRPWLWGQTPAFTTLASRQRWTAKDVDLAWSARKVQGNLF